MYMKTTMLVCTLFMLLSTAISVGGCNTVSGAGEDISSAGKAIEKTAD